MRAAPPEDADLELAGFKPHLLVHNDTVRQEDEHGGFKERDPETGIPRKPYVRDPIPGTEDEPSEAED